MNLKIMMNAVSRDLPFVQGIYDTGSSIEPTNFNSMSPNQRTTFYSWIAEYDEALEESQYNAQKPRIRDILGELSELEIKRTDFTLLGLTKTSPAYEKGRKTKAEYLDQAGNVVVLKEFSDVMTDGQLTALQVVFKWIDHNGDVAFQKTEIVRSFNPYEAFTELRKRRQRIVDYLFAGAQASTASKFISALYEFYNFEIHAFIEKGSSELADYMLNDERPAEFVIDGVTYQLNQILDYEFETSSGATAKLRDLVRLQVT